MNVYVAKTGRLAQLRPLLLFGPQLRKSKPVLPIFFPSPPLCPAPPPTFCPNTAFFIYPMHFVVLSACKCSAERHH